MNSVEIIPRRLYWISDRSPPVVKGKTHTFSIDNELSYIPYASDFGPLNLACIYRYCLTLDNILSDPRLERFAIYHYTSLIPAKRANAAFLMAAYQILKLQKTADEAWEGFLSVSRFIPFRDASSEGSPFELYIIDCLKGLEKAVALGWFSLESFDIESYERLSRYEYGGLNWVIPDRLLAFGAPAERKSASNFTVDDYIPLFKSLGVTAVIRLNKEKYDTHKFTKNNINFQDLYFHDGSVPEDHIVNDFISIVNREKGAVGVHCKAGLGRTGTLIGCYAIKHFDFQASEYIGWARMCRPGSVLGPQQYFLCEYEEKIRQNPRRSEIQRTLSPQIGDRGQMTLFEKYRAKYGEMGQADRLVQNLQSAPTSPVNPLCSSKSLQTFSGLVKLRIPNERK